MYLMCELWCHKECGNISDDMFKLCELQKKEMGAAYWICHCCRSFATKMASQMKEMDKKINKLENSVSSNQAEIESIVKEKIEKYPRSKRKQTRGRATILTTMCQKSSVSSGSRNLGRTT